MNLFYFFFFFLLTVIQAFEPYAPNNDCQMKYCKMLQSSKFPILVVEGPAGTGKTMMACQEALRLLEANQIEKIVLTRPVIAADEGIGFLKGGMEEKMVPWLLPVLDSMKELQSQDKVRTYLQNGKIEIAPLAFMRGRTFKSSFVIAEEMQNATPNQVRMLLTRLGERSRMVLTGDVTQHDLPSHQIGGLPDLLERLSHVENPYEKGIGIVRFKKRHVQRHPILEVIHELYPEDSL